MLLKAANRQNPELVDFAASLHSRGMVAPNTHVIDADTVALNAARTAEAAGNVGLQLNVMTKQFGRNPRTAEIIAGTGLSRFVAVDVDEARTLWRAGLDVTHVGHLVGTSAYDVDEVVSHRPEAVTVFNLEQAARIDEACRAAGHRQRLFLRMYDPIGAYHPCQHGGFLLDELDFALSRLARMDCVTAAGVTTHPCLIWDYETGKGGATPKLALLRTAADALSSASDVPIEINAPGVTCIATLDLLKHEGASTGEPGSSLTGSTPLNAFSDQPEVPAIVYVSEVSHMFGDRVFTFGGGFYARGHVKGALIGRGGRSPETYLPAVPSPAEAIDYYGELSNAGNADVQVGDTAVYAFRNQVFVTRARVAVVEGLRAGIPRVTGVFSSVGEPLAGR